MQVCLLPKPTGTIELSATLQQTSFWAGVKENTGFGGYIYRRMGCRDYPLQQEEYEIFRSQEMNSTGYHVK